MLIVAEHDSTPFWERKTLDELSSAEWEALCDGCGRCCMLKLEDEDTDIVYLTRISCKLLSIGTCRCTDYANRHDQVPDCLRLTPDMIKELSWLPDTCAYRLVGEGRPLAWWHPLLSGNSETVHEAGVSVRSWALAETETRVEQLYKYLIIDDEA